MLLKNEIGILITPYHVVSFVIIETEIEYSMRIIDPGLIFFQNDNKNNHSYNLFCTAYRS